MRNLKRALSLGLTATMISGLMVMGSSAASYADVTSKQNEEAIEVLKTVGIMVGDENGKFNPEAKVTRNEMAVVMCNLLDYTVASYKGTSPFTDVPEWAEPYVAACYTNGITSGYDKVTYGGNDTVTTGQAALMLLKALGYFQYSADFGSDWLVETTKNGSTAGLFDGVATGAKEALTRNDVAQMVLNALEADLVKAEKNGSDVQVGDIVISGGKATYDSRTGTDSKYAKIDNTKVDGKYTIQLGEDLYDGDLVKADGADDDFGRPSVKWTFENKEVGTYADDADTVYTSSVEKQDLYDLVGSDVYADLKSGDADFTVVVDGVDQDAKLSDYIVKNNDDDAGKDVIKKGATTEVFIDDDSNDVVIAVINSYVAQVDGDYDKNDEELDLKALDGTELPADDTTLSADDFDYLDTYSDEDYVLVTVANKEIKTIALAETVEGKVTGYTQKKNVTVDGTKYEYSKNYTKAVDEEMKYDLNEAYTVVLDANGYVVYADVVYIGGDDLSVSGDSDDRVYVLESKPDAKVDSDDNKYYEYDAIVNGKIDTIKAGSDSIFKEIGLYENISYDSDNYVDRAVLVDGTDSDKEDFMVYTDVTKITYKGGVLSLGEGKDVVLADKYTIFVNDDGDGKTATPSSLEKNFNATEYNSTVFVFEDDKDEAVEIYVYKVKDAGKVEDVEKVDAKIKSVKMWADGGFNITMTEKAEKAEKAVDFTVELQQRVDGKYVSVTTKKVTLEKDATSVSDGDNKFVLESGKVYKVVVNGVESNEVKG